MAVKHVCGLTRCEWTWRREPFAATACHMHRGFNIIVGALAMAGMASRTPQNDAESVRQTLSVSASLSRLGRKPNRLLVRAAGGIPSTDSGIFRQDPREVCEWEAMGTVQVGLRERSCTVAPGQVAPLAFSLLRRSQNSGSNSAGCGIRDLGMTLHSFLSLFSSASASSPHLTSWARGEKLESDREKRLKK